MLRDLASAETLSSPEPQSLAPTQLVAGKYRIVELLGEGGMGTVWLASDERLDRRVVIKSIRQRYAQSSAATERFFREARAAARLKSEHVIRVFDTGTLADGAPFIVLEHLEGCDLGELLHQQGSLSQRDAVDCVLQALDALAEAHEAGIVHRDIKPENLFSAVMPDGHRSIKVLDFGIAKLTDAESVRMTGTRELMGSPNYMSPEQISAPISVDSRSDLWSIGVVLYELLGGQLLFDGSMTEVLGQVLDADIDVAGLKVDPLLRAVLEGCLLRDRTERWPDATSLMRALAPFASKRVRASLRRLTVRSPEPVSIALDKTAAAPSAEPTALANTLPTLRSAAPEPVKPVVDTFQVFEKAGPPTTPIASGRSLLFAAGLACAIGSVVMLSLWPAATDSTPAPSEASQSAPLRSAAAEPTVSAPTPASASAPATASAPAPTKKVGARSTPARRVKPAATPKHPPSEEADLDERH